MGTKSNVFRYILIISIIALLVWCGYVFGDVYLHRENKDWLQMILVPMVNTCAGIVLGNLLARYPRTRKVRVPYALTCTPWVDHPRGLPIED